MDWEQIGYQYAEAFVDWIEAWNSCIWGDMSVAEALADMSEDEGDQASNQFHIGFDKAQGRGK